MRWLVLIMCCTVSMVHAGKVYVCKNGQGETLYSQTPCPQEYNNVEERQVETRPSSGGASGAQLDRMAREVSQNNSRIRLERELRRAEKRLQELQEERKQMVSKQSELASSIAGPNARNRAQAVVDEMKSSADRYNQQISQQRQKISDTKQRLSELNKAVSDIEAEPLNRDAAF